MFSCLAHNFFLVWHWRTIFGTWVYRHKTMSRVHSWSRFDVDLWLPGQLYRLLSCLHVQPVSSFSFDFGIPYLARGSITMRDASSTLMILIRPWPLTKFTGFITWLCSGLTFFVLWQSHTLSCTWVYHHGTMCHIHSWTLYDLEFESVFALWHRHTKFWPMGVSPWDNMLCTFLTLVSTWPLTCMWVTGLSLVSFTQFLSCLSFFELLIKTRAITMPVAINMFNKASTPRI